MQLVKQMSLLPYLMLVVPAAVLGAAIGFVPWVAFLLLGVAVLVLVAAPVVLRLTLWQNLAFVALAGYITLNYGFANWAFHFGGIPIPVGHLFAFTALLLALQGRASDVKAFLREPIVFCWLLLLGLSFIHLLIDIPQFVAYAIRDASFVVEGAFLLLGFLWARRTHDINSFLKALALIFLLHFVYTLTYPIAGILRANSPKSGIFLQVPLLGLAAGEPFFLIVGALFYLLVAKRVVGWPSTALQVLALLQAGWSIVFQARSMYVGIIVAVLLLLFFGEGRKAVKVAGGLMGGAALLILMLSFFNVDLAGRVGPVEPSFFIRHFRSLLLDSDTHLEGSVVWRLDLLPEVWARWTAGLSTILVGEGFGEPIIDFYSGSGVAVRQPHNTHLTVLVRLGLLGFVIWILMHLKVASLLIRSLRDSRRGTFAHDLNLWFFLFYVLGVLLTTVQPWLEFSYGAIPFFTFIGFAIGLPHENNDVSQRLPNELVMRRR